MKTFEERIYPVGRLDFDTTGALIMSNDGEFANMIMHPRSHLEKIYEVTIKGLIKGEDLHRLEKGIYIDGAKTIPCKIKVTFKDMEHKSTVLLLNYMKEKTDKLKNV